VIAHFRAQSALGPLDRRSGQRVGVHSRGVKYAGDDSAWVRLPWESDCAYLNRPWEPMILCCTYG